MAASRIASILSQVRQISWLRAGVKSNCSLSAAAAVEGALAAHRTMLAAAAQAVF
jgi:hypothetical protein